MTTPVQPPHWPPCFYTRAPCSIMPSFINVSPIYKCQLVYVICKNKTNNINGLRQQKCISCSQKCSVPLFPVDEKLSSRLILFYSSDMLRVLESSTSSKRGKRVEKAYVFLLLWPGSDTEHFCSYSTGENQLLGPTQMLSNVALRSSVDEQMAYVATRILI